VLNVGKAHLGEFGTQQDIARAKGELVEALPTADAGGLAVLNGDDPLVAGMAGRTSARVLTFGTGDGSDVRLADLEVGADGRPAFTLSYAGERAEVRLRLLGAHMATNAAAAGAVALGLGMDLGTVAARLGEVGSLSRWRMELHERGDGTAVLNDAYNANPDSMAAALRALVAVAQGRGARSVAVLGEMLELGESSAAEHREVGRLAGELGVGRVVGVGPAAAAIVAGARETSEEEPVQVEDNTAAVTWLREHTGPGDVVLVKASRGARLDEVADALLSGGEA
jgi:UDP-N-acetylmuramoyl-tripeptide--D-alanyl-D-alanine ligase